MKHQITAVKLLFAAAIAVSALALAPAPNANAAESVLTFCPKSSIRYKEVSAGTATGEAATVDNIAECNLSAKHSDEEVTITALTIINVVLSVVGILAVVVIIIGGINFILSQGDSAKVTKARNTILYGVVGLIVALLAFAIVNFVLSSLFSGSSETSSGEEESSAHYSIVA